MILVMTFLDWGDDYHLGRCMADDGEVRSYVGRVAELPHCLAAITTLLGVVSALQLLEQKLCVLGLS